VPASELVSADPTESETGAKGRGYHRWVPNDPLI
jgi:hypothetical protein